MSSLWHIVQILETMAIDVILPHLPSMWYTRGPDGGPWRSLSPISKLYLRWVSDSQDMLLPFHSDTWEAENTEKLDA